MVLVKVLKRKDASSVLVAIVLAMIVQQPLMMMSGKPASIISGLHNTQGIYYYSPGGGWQTQYLLPIVTALVQVLFLELLIWVVVFLLAAWKMAAKKK